MLQDILVYILFFLICLLLITFGLFPSLREQNILTEGDLTRIALTISFCIYYILFQIVLEDLKIRNVNSIDATH